MAMRLSGLISGMDTEAVVKSLMDAHRLKSTKVQNKITTTEWKQEKWKALNSKIYSLYTGQLSKLRMQGSFAVKKATSSNIGKVEVTAGSNAPEGTHLIKVKQLASSQFVTGAKLDTDNKGNQINSNTKLVDLGFDASEGTTIQIKNGEKQVNLDIREKTTVGNLIASLQSAGLNASYDTTQKRFFISSKASGVENAFEITSSSSVQVQDKNAIRDFLSYDLLSNADKSKVDNYLNSYLNDTLTPEDKVVIEDKLLEIKYGQVRTKFVNDYMTNQSKIDEVTPEVEAELRLSLGLEEGEPLDDAVLQAAIKDRLRLDAEVAATAEYEAWKNNEAEVGNVFLAAEGQLDTLLTAYANAANEPISQTGSLANLGFGEIRKNIDGKIEINGNPQAVLVQATDSIVIYNGAELTGSSNNFSVNGLTLTLKGVTVGLDTPGTEDDETISLSVAGNTEAVYDMVKDFVKSYNELLKEMNDAYNAKSSRGYDPLTDDERATMTEEQIEKWETKIKDSLLRRDNILGGLIDVMRSSLNEGVTVNGKKYSLSSYGITTGSYTEKGLLHISGDEDFATVASLENKLMDALNNNPEEAAQVMTKIADNLYSSLMDKMKSTTLSSALTVYNDKEMSKTLANYKSDLAKMEAKLLDIENKYFKQFAAMETAMAKMNSQSSALMSMLGMNSNQN
ncbi:MAG: flagellar filament capping protein FliD [Clostridiales bacterium]|jgi:flagellar hook-associated protein 2|nr:flagellar filament capping protein FliD [Clostridiales bacterium]